MKEKFTKGSWLAKTHDEEIKRAVVYLNEGGFDISNCPDCVANAHLIAAAPKMYAMLKELAAKERSGTTASLAIESLLAKARGEQ
jgi:hypothetical protein